MWRRPWSVPAFWTRCDQPTGPDRATGGPGCTILAGGHCALWRGACGPGESRGGQAGNCCPSLQEDPVRHCHWGGPFLPVPLIQKSDSCGHRELFGFVRHGAPKQHSENPATGTPETLSVFRVRAVTKQDSAHLRVSCVLSSRGGYQVK